MASLRSNRCSVSSQSSASSRSSQKSNGSASTASSVPSERSGYVKDANADGTRTSFETTRYQRLWLGGPVMYRGDGNKACITEDAMRRRADALVVDRAQKALKRMSRASNQNARPTAIGKREKLEYSGFVSELWVNRNWGEMVEMADVLTLGGTVYPTRPDEYQNSTLPEIGMLVYKRLGRKDYDGTLVARRDVRCFGCIRDVGIRDAGYSPTISVWDCAGQELKLHISQFEDQLKLERGMLVYKVSDAPRYIARVGK